MKSVSILGCGWLGMALATNLIQKGYKVLGSTTQQSKLESLSSAGIHPFLINFNPSINIDDADFFGSDVLVITIPPGRKSGKTETYSAQIDAIIAELKKGTTRNIIFISSTSVYPSLNRVVSENDADPESYLFKVEQKFLSQPFLQTTVLRFGGLYGPGRNPGRFLSGKTNIEGAHSPVNMIHQQDCVAVIGGIIEKNVWNEIFNACSDNHPAKKEFYTKAALEAGLDVPQFNESAEAPYKIVSSEKLKQRLTYTFRF